MSATGHSEVPTITVVVSTYRRPEAVRRALASLGRQTLPRAAFEVIVVDNDPSDGATLAVVEGALADGLPASYHAEAMLGLSHARNRGLEAARGPIAAFIDDDAEASPAWLERLCGAAGRVEAGLMALGGPVRPVWRSRQPPWLPDSFLPALSLVDYGPERRCLRFPDQFLVGCNLAFDANFLRETGGFSPALGRRGGRLLGNEDIDAQRRVADAGGAIVYEPEALVYHHIPRERERFPWFVRRIYYQGLSDAFMERGAPSWPRGRLPIRLFSHLRLSLRPPARPAHVAFTLVMAAAYGAGRAAGALVRER